MSQPEKRPDKSGIEDITNIYMQIEVPQDRFVELDMGCGKGGFLIELARRYPERMVIGLDVMSGRLRKVARQAKRADLSNVRLLRANSREAVAYQLPDGCVDRLHILCPDPWPKERHRRRRLLNSDFLHRVLRIMSDGGVIHLSSDDTGYLALVWKNLRYVSQIRTVVRQAPNDICDVESEFERQWKETGKSVDHITLTV